MRRSTSTAKTRGKRVHRTLANWTCPCSAGQLQLQSHTERLAGLPPIHRDPFDRLLVAQAQAEPMRLLTSDRLLAAYGASVEVV